MNEQYISKCCGAPVDEDLMICPHCNEPCDIVEVEVEEDREEGCPCCGRIGGCQSD